MTPTGTYKKSNLWPRISNGPDMDNLILGSEGNYGLITSAVLRVRPLPKSVIFDSLLFHNLDQGIDFMYAVAKTKCWPTSLRLIDSEQFRFGAALKPESESKWEEFMDAAKKFFVLNFMGFKPDEMVAATLMLEGTENWTKSAHKQTL